ncbi:MAG: hypothetical protein ACFE88_13910 [Candidatus Hermodarchaeota archaeon]
MKDNDLIRLERIDYTDQVLDAINNWKRNPELIDSEKYNKYKDIILSKIKDKSIPYTTEIERITIDTNSKGKKEEEFILSMEFDDGYLNFIEDVFFTNECSSLNYNIDSDVNELCEIWGERPLKLKELFYNTKKKELIKQNGETNKEKEFEKRFHYIERDLIRENKFSIAKSELGKIIHDAKINNLSETLDQARGLLRFCNIKEREFAQKRKEEEAALYYQKEFVFREEVSKARNLILQKKVLEGKKLLENVIQESKSLPESVSSSIFNQASEILDYCHDFMENEKELSNIEDLIKGKKYSTAISRLKDLIDAIETYIGDKMLINNEILNEASILFKKYRIYAPEESLSEDSISEDSFYEEEKDEINELEKEVKKFNIKSLVQNVNNITELNHILTKRWEFLNRLYRTYADFTNNEYGKLTELTELIILFYTSYLDFNPFEVNIQYFPQTFFNIKSTDLRYLENYFKREPSKHEIERLLKQLENIDYDVMFDKKLIKIGKQIQKFNYDIPVENLFNLLLDFMKILPDPTTTKIEDNNDEYILQTTWGILYFKIIEKLPFEKLIYEYDFLKSNWGEKGRLYLDFLEPDLGKATIHIKNEIIEVAKHHREKLIIHNFIGNNLKSFIDMNLGKIVAKQIHTMIYEKDFDDLTIGNFGILKAKIQAMGKDINNLRHKFYEVRAPLTLASFNCSECGATLNIRSKEEKFIICEHCDTPFLMEWQKE